MDRLSANSKGLPRNIPVDLLAVGFAHGTHCSMRVEEVSAGRLLLRTKHAVRPLDQIELMCWIAADEEPLYAITRAQYVERTWAGYCVEASLERMGASDCSRWERFIASASESCPELGAAPPDARRPQLVAVGNALPPILRTVLTGHGLIVHHARTSARALELLAKQPDILVADSGGATIDIASLCQQLGTQTGAPDLLLIVEYASEQDLDRYLEMGATRVILQPYNQQTLIRRIRTTLIERAELKNAAYSSSATLTAVGRDEPPRTPFDPRRGFWSSLRSHIRHIVAHAIPSLFV